MKFALIAIAMVMSSVSFAKAPASFVVKVCEGKQNNVNCQNRIYSYGAGATTKSMVVCYKEGNRDCHKMTYNYFAPRVETVGITNNKGEVVKTYKRVTQGNYATWIGSAKK